MDRRRKDSAWLLTVNDDGTVPHSDAELAVLMDIRDELKAINRKLDCWRIPRALDALISMGKDLRRRERARRKRSKGRK